jgi:hypothetical protein
VVTYAPDYGVLVQTLRSLVAAINAAIERAVIGKATITLIDNGPGIDHETALWSLIAKACENETHIHGEVLSGHGNVGYGRGHNIAIERSRADYHLVLNPDVTCEQRSVFEAVEFFDKYPDAGLLAPRVLGASGDRQYLCKRYPTIFDLLLRAFAPGIVKRIFEARLHKYEMRDVLKDEVVLDVPIVSGCFMFFRRAVLCRVGGFSPEYFMYFEDFDLSLKSAAIARTAYAPSVGITHFGGHAARKGLRHMKMFVKSGWTFFQKHGWRLW